jgi:hypothetical protein
VPTTVLVVVLRVVSVGLVVAVPAMVLVMVVVWGVIAGTVSAGLSVLVLVTMSVAAPTGVSVMISARRTLAVLWKAVARGAGVGVPAEDGVVKSMRGALCRTRALLGVVLLLLATLRLGVAL